MVYKHAQRVFVLFWLLLLITPRLIHADVSPEYPFRSPCPNGLKAYYCDIVAKDYNSPPLIDECKKYQDNPNFSILSWTKYFEPNDSKFGIMTLRNSIQYCGPAETPDTFKLILQESFFREYSQLLLFTLIFEFITIIWFKSFRRKRLLLGFFLANFLSLFLFKYALALLPLATMALIILGEIFVVLFEILFVSLFGRTNRKYIQIPILVANLVSAILGSIIYYQLFN